jgi:hypothetical protein
MNSRQQNDPRFWEVWKAAGAVGTMEGAYMRQLEGRANELASQGRLVIGAIGEHYAGPATGNSTLSLGERVIAESPDGKITSPEMYVVAPGHGYKLGQELDKLPEGSRPLETVFPEKKATYRR